MRCKVCGYTKFDRTSSLVTGDSLKGEGTDRVLLKCRRCKVLNTEMRKVQIVVEGSSARR